MDVAYLQVEATVVGDGLWKARGSEMPPDMDVGAGY